MYPFNYCKYIYSFYLITTITNCYLFCTHTFQHTWFETCSSGGESDDQLLNTTIMRSLCYYAEFNWKGIAIESIPKFEKLSNNLCRSFCDKTNFNSGESFMVKQNRLIHSFVVYYFSYFLPSLTSTSTSNNSSIGLWTYFSVIFLSIIFFIAVKRIDTFKIWWKRVFRNIISF